MKESTGNLWSQHVEAICITTNGYVNSKSQAVMGRGCALEAAEKFPGLREELGDLIRLGGGNHVHVLLTPRYGWYDGEEGMEYTTEVLSFPVKHHWREKADLALIRRSAMELVEKTDLYQFDTVCLPRPGCGNGQLTWEEVKPIIEPILDDRFTVITF